MANHADEGLLTLPGGKRIEELLVDPDNTARSDKLLAGLAAKIEMARTRGAGFAPAEAAKKILAGVFEEMELEPEYVTDRLTLGWLQGPENEEAARDLVRSLREALDAVAA